MELLNKVNPTVTTAAVSLLVPLMGVQRCLGFHLSAVASQHAHRRTQHRIACQTASGILESGTSYQ